MTTTPTTAEPKDAPLVPIPRVDPSSPPCGECHLQPGERCDICGRCATPAEIAQPATPEPLAGLLDDIERVVIRLAKDAGYRHRAAEDLLSAAKRATQASAPSVQVVEPIPKGYIVIDKELLAQAIFTNTDASLAEARHIINTTLKVSDSPVYRAAGDEA